MTKLDQGLPMETHHVPPSLNPTQLLSLAYVHDAHRSWCLLRTGLQLAPAWAGTEPRWRLFREIAFLQANGTLDGIGRAWIRLNKDGLRLWLSCLVPKPRPLGERLMCKYGTPKIEVPLEETIDPPHALSSYYKACRQVLHFRRLVRVCDADTPFVITEEYFIADPTNEANFPL